MAELIKRGVPLCTYTEMLGTLSAEYNSSAVAGVHGKTTTTALAGTILKTMDFPCTVIVGSAVADFDGHSTWCSGSRYLIAETCEYRRHFLDYHPKRILLTSVEPDHLDYFKDYGDILSAFTEFGLKLPDNGTLVFCADDPGAVEASDCIRIEKPEIRFIPYGFKADGPFRIVDHHTGNGFNTFCLAGFGREFSLRQPGTHTVLNAAGAIALIDDIIRSENKELNNAILDRIAEGLSSFRGSKRRSEILGEAGGILFMDDYGHHPTAIKKTLSGLKDFYPGRRIIVDFASHTYSRTEGLLEEFSSAFGDADTVILHKIYPSAREKSFPGDLDKRFADMTGRKHPRVHYFPEKAEGEFFLKNYLQPGDLLLTMGAGDNWTIGENLFHFYRDRR